jgi:hypothetical protein
MSEPVMSEPVTTGSATTGSAQEEQLATEAAARQGRLSDSELADLQEKYDQMMRLADVFDSAGDQMRAMSRLGADVLRDPAVSESAELSPATYRQAEDDVRSATTGKHGLLSRSIEVDVDALVVRATVLTYRWIDELQSAAYETLGAIAARAIGYLAPNVALGGAIVSAGLIETDALDRDGVAAYLSELAENNPELMEHVTTGGGGLLDGLQMRSLLTAAVLAGDSGRAAAEGGLRAIGAADFGVDASSALRDVAGGLLETTATTPPVSVEVDLQRPRTIADLMTALESSPRSVRVHQVVPGRFIAYLTGPNGGSGRRLRLVGGDSASYALQVVRSIESAVKDSPGAHLMLVGSAAGGVTAAEVAATVRSDAFVIDQVLTAGAPAAHVPRMPERIRMLSLEDRSDPVALLGSLVNVGAPNRMTVIFDGGATEGLSLYVAGGRAADGATHPDVRAEISRIQQLGYLAG